LQYKNIPAQKGAGIGGFYLSQSFLFISGFLLQPPSCVFEQFLHLPDLFSDFDIFHPFVNVCFCCVRT